MAEQTEAQRIKEWKESTDFIDYSEKLCDNCAHMTYDRNKEESMSTQQFCTKGKFWTHADASCNQFKEEE